MTFLQPAMLIALPLAALPVIIHLIHLARRKPIPWAAMMFLRMAQRMNRGISRLRQVLILTLRVLALAAVVFVICRPLAGGWLGLTGGAPDTVLVLVDRSASMEQQNPATGASKRSAGLANLAKALSDTVGTRSRLIVIDSAQGEPIPIEKPDSLVNLSQTEATDTAADLPGLLRTALDYITTNKTGRTDVWLLSDLQASDWDASSGRWETLRSAFATLKGVRFHLLCFPEATKGDLSVRIDRIVRKEGAEKAEILLDFRIRRDGENAEPIEVPLRLVLDGVVTTGKVKLEGTEAVLQAYAVPIDKGLKRGRGMVELPDDTNISNNRFYFVFDEPPPLRSVIVTDDPAEAAPLKAALSAVAHPGQAYISTILSSGRAAEIAWDETGLIVWQTSIPTDLLAGQLKAHVSNGRALLFLPPEKPDEGALFGLRWGKWQNSEPPRTVDWWRNDSDLLANTRDGAALPVGTLEIPQWCQIVGDGVPLARISGTEPLLMRTSEPGRQVYFLGTLPKPGASSLARDGVVLFALLHRALDEGSQSLGKAQQRAAAWGVLGSDSWVPLEGGATLSTLAIRAGVAKSGEKLTALNRPPGEDQPERLSTAAVHELFAGLDFRILTDSLTEGRNLTNEVWKTFLIAMALALLAEALLCMPPRRETEPVKAAN